MCAASCRETGARRILLSAEFLVVVLKNDGNAVVVHQIQGAVCTGVVRELVPSVPVYGKVGSRVHVGHVGKLLVVDTHLGSSAARGNCLQSQVHVLAVGLAGHWQDQDFTVGRIAAGCMSGTVEGGLCHCLPAALCRRGVGVCIDVVQSSASGTARYYYATVRHLLALGLVAAGHRSCLAAAQGMPCNTEVIAVYHAVAVRTCVQSSIQAVVFARLYYAALEQLAAAYEPRLHYVVSAVEQAVYLLRLVYGRLPCLTSVAAVDIRNYVRILACSRRIYGTSADCHYQHLVALAVGNYGSIAIGSLHRCLHVVYQRGVAYGHWYHVGPCDSVVVADAADYVDLSIPGVGAAYLARSRGYQAPVGCRHDAWNTVCRHYAVTVAGVEQVYAVTHGHLYLVAGHYDESCLAVRYAYYAKVTGCRLAVQDEESSVVCILCRIGLQCDIGIVSSAYLYVVYFLACQVDMLEFPLQVIGSLAVSCFPCRHETYAAYGKIVVG